jgi:hypothetical protein
MPVTVVLEGRGEVPCEVVGEPRWRDVAVADDYGRKRAVRYGLVRVVPDGEDGPRWVAVERVRGWSATDPKLCTERPTAREALPKSKRGATHRPVLDGVAYPSLRAACTALGADYSTARDRLRAGYSMAVATTPGRLVVAVEGGAT